MRPDKGKSKLELSQKAEDRIYFNEHLNSLSAKDRLILERGNEGEDIFSILQFLNHDYNLIPALCFSGRPELHSFFEDHHSLFNYEQTSVHGTYRQGSVALLRQPAPDKFQQYLASRSFQKRRSFYSKKEDKGSLKQNCIDLFEIIYRLGFPKVVTAQTLMKRDKIVMLRSAYLFGYKLVGSYKMADGKYCKIYTLGDQPAAAIEDFCAITPSPPPMLRKKAARGKAKPKIQPVSPRARAYLALGSPDTCQAELDCLYLRRHGFVHVVNPYKVSGRFQAHSKTYRLISNLPTEDERFAAAKAWVDAIPSPPDCRCKKCKSEGLSVSDKFRSWRERNDSELGGF